MDTITPDRFSRNQIKDFITSVEDDLAEFIGHRYCMARLAGFVERQRQLGEVSDSAADALLEDLAQLGRCAELGQKFGRWVRNPPAELEMMVLSTTRELA